MIVVTRGEWHSAPRTLVRFLRSAAIDFGRERFSFSPGMVVRIPALQADEWERAGVCKRVEEDLNDEN